MMTSPKRHLEYAPFIVTTSNLYHGQFHNVQLYSDQAGSLQWLMYASGDLYHSVSGWVGPTCPGHTCRDANPGTVAASKSALLARLEALNTQLVSRTFLVGERLSLADIAMAIALVPAYEKVSYFYHQSGLSLIHFFYFL